MLQYGFLLLLSACCCFAMSVQDTGRDKRVVGGVVLKKGEYPFLVSLWQIGLPRNQPSIDSGLNHSCGGVLVHKQWVVTAGHCFEGGNFAIKANWRVYVGMHAQTKAKQEAQMRLVTRVFLPKKYNKPYLYADIAMVKLDRPVTLKPGNTEIASLNNLANCPAVGDDVRVMGWGKTKLPTKPDLPSKSIPLKVTPLGPCHTLFNKKEVLKVFNTKSLTVDKTTICAGVAEKEKNACFGDSGGPLVARCGGKDNVLVGTVSYGYGCDNPNTPTVYTRISSYLKWIRDIIKQF